MNYCPSLLRRQRLPKLDWMCGVQLEQRQDVLVTLMINTHASLCQHFQHKFTTDVRVNFVKHGNDIITFSTAIDVPQAWRREWWFRQKPANKVDIKPTGLNDQKVLQSRIEETHNLCNRKEK